MLDIQISTAILRDVESKHSASVVIHHDISERKLAEITLTDSQELFRAIV